MFSKLMIKYGLHFLGENSTVQEAVILMAEKDMGTVVIGTVDTIQGIFSERDVIKRVLAKGKDPKTTLLTEVMTKKVIFITEEEKPLAISNKFKKNKIRHLVVVNSEGKGVGMLGIRDFMDYMIRKLEEENHVVQDVLLDKVPDSIKRI